MCNEILPENVNLILDEFERALCLPILLGVFYFTVLLAIPLATSVYCTTQKYLKSSSRKSGSKSKSFVSQIKGMIGLSLFGESDSESSSPYCNPRSADSRAWISPNQDLDEYDCQDDDEENGR